MLNLAHIEEQLNQLKNPVLDLINQYTLLTEHELIGYLQTPPYELLDKQLFRDNDSLFCTHFLIRHLLYKIQKNWYETQEAYLHIDIKHIHKRAYQTHSGQAITEYNDSLSGYYLDLNQLLNMNSHKVDALLKSFWRKFLSYENTDASLKCLGLESGASLKDIQHQYRKLAMQYHPDKGGSSEEFAQINQAYEHLKRCLS